MWWQRRDACSTAQQLVRNYTATCVYPAIAPHRVLVHYNLCQTIEWAFQYRPICSSVERSSLKYVSTRGEAPVLGFRDTLLAGLARDGGLYVPEAYPQFDADTLRQWRGLSYADIAKNVLQPFVDGEIEEDVFGSMIDKAYGNFNHPAVTPLTQIDSNHWILELFHGPTMAFKDVAMQLLGPMMDHVLREKGARATIIGATSGDTGGAAIEAFRGLDNVDIFILFPHGKVSPVQQRQMTTVADANVHAIAIEGNFDDCQSLVKSMFNHHDFRDRMAITGVNSINWGRIMAQVVYYFTSAIALGAPDREISFTVPTGNFGDVFAGFVAKNMGLPIKDLIVATNTNDILARTLDTGRYEVTGVSPTISPSMDIQVSSNFERLLFEAGDRNSAAVSRAMSSLSQSGAFSLDPQQRSFISKSFKTGTTEEHETGETIATTLRDTGTLLDPHTAVAVSVANQQAPSATPMITLSTAHPAKFPDAVEAACGERPALPAFQGDLMNRKEHFTVLANDLAMIESHIEARVHIGADITKGQD